MSDLIGLTVESDLWRLQPELRYHFIDVGVFGEAELAARDGLPALWFRLETATDPDRAEKVAKAVRAVISSQTFDLPIVSERNVDRVGRSDGAVCSHIHRVADARAGAADATRIGPG